MAEDNEREEPTKDEDLNSPEWPEDPEFIHEADVKRPKIIEGPYADENETIEKRDESEQTLRFNAQPQLVIEKPVIEILDGAAPVHRGGFPSEGPPEYHLKYCKLCS